MNDRLDSLDAIGAARTDISGNGVSDPEDATTPFELVRLRLDIRTQVVRTAAIPIDANRFVSAAALEAVGMEVLQCD